MCQYPSTICHARSRTRFSRLQHLGSNTSGSTAFASCRTRFRTGKKSLKLWDMYTEIQCNFTSSAFGSEEDGLFPAQRVYDPVPPVTTVEGWEFGSLAFIDQSYAIMEAEPWQLIRRAPLFRRAWVLQEQLLDRHPPRSRTQTR
jgi:hypothetical protein